MSARYAALVTVLLLVAVSSSAFAAGAVAQPTWPQQFSAVPGEGESFGFGVTQPGQVTVEVTWQGVPLSIVLRGPDGKPVNSVTPQAGPSAKVVYDVTAADIRKGILWSVLIIAPAPKPGGQPVANGQVNVKCPPVDAGRLAQAANAKLEERLSAAKSAWRASPGQSQTQVSSLLQSRVQQYNLTRQSSIASAEWKLKALMRTNTEQYNKMMLQMVASSLTVKMPISPALTGPKMKQVSPGQPQLAADPVLTDVTPGQGVPGDQVYIKGKAIPTDKSQCEVCFTINLGATVPAQIINITQNGDTIIYQVQVPNQAGVSQGYNGVVYMKPKDTGIPTNSLQFRFDPMPVPTISAIDPAVGESGGWLTLNGQNFKPDDVVHCIMPSGDVISDKQYQNATQILARAPSYTSKQPVTALVYVEGKTAGKGNTKGVALKPNIPVIAAVTNAQGSPGDPVLISGSGFKTPVEVHFIVARDGREFTATVTDANMVSDSQVYTHVPDISGVADTFDGQVYVKCGGARSDMASFRFVPDMEFASINLNDVDTGKEFRITDKGTTMSHMDYHDQTRWVAYHCSGIFSGYKGDDEYFVSTNLKNNWVVDEVKWTHTIDDGSSNAYISESHAGTGSHYVKVHWWVDALTGIQEYGLSWVLKGPKGTSWK